MRRRKQAISRWPLLGSFRVLEATGFDNSCQPLLQRKCDCVDMIEEQSSGLGPGRLLRQSDVRRAGVQPARPEQFPLEIVRREQAAVKSDKRAEGGSARCMDSVCDEVGARAWFTPNEDRAFLIGDALHLRTQRLHRRAVADHLAKSPVQELLFESLVLREQLQGDVRREAVAVGVIDHANVDCLARQFVPCLSEGIGHSDVESAPRHLGGQLFARA